MIDWMTYSIEAVGIIIFVIWIIIPIQEFSLIARRLRRQRGAAPQNRAGEESR